MSKVRVSAFFCEDFRVEDTHQPIFLGVMSPSLKVQDLPVEIPNLLFVTMFQIESSLDQIEANLSVELENGEEIDMKDFPISFRKTFKKIEKTSSDEDWMVICHLDLSGLSLTDGMKIKTHLECGDYNENISLRILSGSPSDHPSPVA